MIIQEVSTAHDLREFIQFPKKLYKGCPYYIPPLDTGEMATLTKHPALDFCQLKMWLAREDGQVVGRIAGIINEKCNELKNQKRVRFSWFDTIEDENVAKALMETVEKWGAEQGMEEICGPSRFSNMEHQAMLVEGFDHPSTISCDYNYPYYPQFMEQLDFEKEVDYVQYKVKVQAVPEAIERIAQRVEQQHHIHVRHFRSRTELKKKGREMFKVLNESYHKIFNFIPLTEKEIDWVIRNDLAVARLDLISILEDDQGKMVGISFCLPSLNRTLQKINGKLFPFGWMHILRAIKKNKNVDMYLTGVLPEYNNSGIHVLYHKELNEVFLANGYEYAYTSQQLEDNPAQHIWSRYASEPYCRRRCYKKSIRTAENTHTAKA